MSLLGVIMNSLNEFDHKFKKNKSFTKLCTLVEKEKALFILEIFLFL